MINELTGSNLADRKERGGRGCAKTEALQAEGTGQESDNSKEQIGCGKVTFLQGPEWQGATRQMTYLTRLFLITVPFQESRNGQSQLGEVGLSISPTHLGLAVSFLTGGLQITV